MFMNLKKLVLLLAFATFISSTAIYADDSSLGAAPGCDPQNDALCSAETAVSSEIHNVAATLESWGSPVNYLVSFYNAHHQTVLDTMVSLEGSVSSELSILFGLIRDELISAKTNVESAIADESLQNEVTNDALSVYHTALSTSSMIVGRIVNGATFQDLFHEAKEILGEETAPEDAEKPEESEASVA